MKESKFQSDFIKKLKNIFPGCMILKNDPKYKQGVPDLIILDGKRWAMLEMKKSEKANHQPNQDYWVEKLGQMSYASFVYPENESTVIEELKEVFK